MRKSSGAAALAALLIVALPTGSAVAKLTDEERREMKERVQKEIQKGNIPEIKPGMSFEERLYIRKKQQALEKEKQAQQPPAPPPPAPSSPPKPEKEKTSKHKPEEAWKHRPEKEENWRRRPEHHTPSYRPEYRHDRYPSHSHDWRRERCLRLWGGGGYEYHRCLDGEARYLFPDDYEEENRTIIIETPPPPVIVETPPAAVVPFVDPDGPEDLRADRHEVWFDAEVTAEAVITARDSFGKPRRFHLVGIGRAENPDLMASCIAPKMANRTVRINEVGALNDITDADAEAVIFIGNRVLNLQLLAEGCAEFDARTCSELQLEFCDTFQDAESAARRNRLGIWR